MFDSLATLFPVEELEDVHRAVYTWLSRRVWDEALVLVSPSGFIILGDFRGVAAAVGWVSWGVFFFVFDRYLSCGYFFMI